ncbi:3-keto-5-aminohexanoate cleavage protein, partial [Acinetobacter baumannii]|uniref:3-keto-5-aminohexanoate cleavage protein n=1 Tax=Acinetobacter baumannii TaxID=470 RepID=UPI001146535D
MKVQGVKPELESFDSGMLATARRWLAKGQLPGPAHFDFVMGVPGGMVATPQALMYLLSELPAGATWTVAGIGQSQLPMTTLGILLG